MNLKKIILFLACLLFPALAYAQPQPSQIDGAYWAGAGCLVVTYTGPNGARAMMVDSNGNLCVSAVFSAGGTPFDVNVKQWASGTLGAMANYGTSPGAVLVPGVNAALTNIGANAVSVGAGATGTGSQRTTVAVDSSTVAGSATVPAGQNIIGGVGYDYHKASTTLTKIAGGGTYGGTTTAPQAICLFSSVTVCAPMTMTVSATAAVSGTLTGVMMMKSTTGATAATFRVFVFQSAPTMTGIFNGSTYLVPAADILSGAFVGSWECAAQVVNTDNSYYDCQGNRPIGYNKFNVTGGTLYYVATTTGAYVSGSSETFTAQADLHTSVP